MYSTVVLYSSELATERRNRVRGAEGGRLYYCSTILSSSTVESTQQIQHDKW